jgi:hypothetical protein
MIKTSILNALINEWFCVNASFKSCGFELEVALKYFCLFCDLSAEFELTGTFRLSLSLSVLFCSVLFCSVLFCSVLFCSVHYNNIKKIKIIS